MNFSSIFGGILLTLCCLVTTQANAQLKPNNGVKESKVAVYALKNAKIIVSPTETIEKGTLVIEGDRIIGVGSRISIPDHAIEIDCDGQVIVPSFIDLSSSFGVAKPKRGPWNSSMQLDSKKQGPYYWNESVHPEIDAEELYKFDSKSAEQIVAKGFGYVVTHQQDGIVRGRGLLVPMGSSIQHNSSSTKANFYSFSKGVSQQSYPSSQMGAIALLRQMFYDLEWYNATEDRPVNLSLDAINTQLKDGSPQLFYTSDKWEILRASKIAAEFDLPFNYVGSGNEYEIVDALSELNSTIILPINFPKAYDVENPYITRQIPVSDMKHWELAPYNPGILAQKGIPICITAKGHKSSKEFWKHLRSAISHGLTPENALKALTLEPATLLGVEDNYGTLQSGRFASFMIYDANPFEESASIYEHWSHGDRSVLKEFNDRDIAGTYNLLIKDRTMPIKIKSDAKGHSGSIELIGSKKLENGTVAKDTTKIKVVVQLQGSDVNLQFPVHDSIWSGSVNLRGKVNTKFGVFEGEGMIPTGEWVKWSAIKKAKGKKAKKKDQKIKPESDSLAVAWFPNMAYGFDSIPEATPIVIRGVTVWTNEEDGVIKDATVGVKDGKINFVGTTYHNAPRGSIEIDGKGLHLTSGIIDEHSHIAISKGVNEGGQANSAEVSIGHVVHPDDINIYRQLAGGVTAAQLLHGSANPVGGQSALVKLKWGVTPDEMLIDEAPGFIKFALGENVKQSNWGRGGVRFPQTRMGVEQVFYDAFVRAREYEAKMKAFKSGASKEPVRRDLELDAMVEILNSKRFISCHSYIQSEINMLMHVADSMGFTVNTFTHILEGYKVADKMAEHGVGGSTFSDWWAYKYEVNDAIPYNAKLMQDQGVLVAINSDDAEMGRRLNQEAAKAVKYGGMSEEDAWKMVTLNPAKLLHLDDRMGSIKFGKDADLVLWTDHPLSINAKAKMTIVDGIIQYDMERDAELRERNQAEKARIVAKMLKANKNGEKRAFNKKKKGHYHCDTLGEEASHEENGH